mmetsp:Transcript_79399/g.179142  ORF Transcript_79399/g.179142 Transcript_79399/m.179142 type:complete len:266 (+) Transcript_79399:80-877(+)
MVARRVWCGLLWAAGSASALEEHTGAVAFVQQSVAVHEDPVPQKAHHYHKKVEPEKIRYTKSTTPAPRYRASFAPTYMKAPDGTWIPCKIQSFGTSATTFNVLVMPAGFASYEVPNVHKSLLRKVEQIEEVIPTRPPRATPAPKPILDHYVRLKVKSKSGKDIVEAKMLTRGPMKVMFHMACDKLGLGKWSCERDSTFYSSKGTKLQPTDTPETLAMEDNEEITILRNTANLHGKYAHKEREELEVATKQESKEEESHEQGGQDE